MISEIDLKDKHDNIIIQPGLKVRHKKSQYEYTVDSIVKSPDNKIDVILRMPEQPRFEPEPEEQGVISDDVSKQDVLYDVNPDEMYFLSDDKAPPAEDEFLAVPQEEFEKDYEVK